MLLVRPKYKSDRTCEYGTGGGGGVTRRTSQRVISVHPFTTCNLNTGSSVIYHSFTLRRMPRGNKHNNNNNYRARGGNQGRGRGRGRGGPNPDSTPTTPATNRAPRHPYPHANAEIDVVIQQWTELSTVPGALRGWSSVFIPCFSLVGSSLIV